MDKAGFKKVLNMFSRMWNLFKALHPIQYASSFAYFALLGLPAILLIIISVLSIFFEREILFDELGQQLDNVLGEKSAEIVVIITKGYLAQTQKDVLNLIFYTYILLIVSSQIMVFFQNALNELWLIKPDFKNVWQRILIVRGVTLLMVVATGCLFFTSVATEQILNWLISEGLSDAARQVIISMVTVITVYLWFAILYKLLPHCKIMWEPVLVGAAVTTGLFFIGTGFLWETVVKQDSLRDMYGYVTPIVLVSFWIFYNSIAFLIGASFTKAYAEYRGKRIEPRSYATRFKTVADEG